MKKMESISRKIWKVMTITVIAFIIVIFILNITLINGVRNNMIYDDIEHRIEYGEFNKLNRLEDDFDGISDENDNLHVAQCVINRTGSEDIIEINEMTRELINTKYDKGIIDSIYNEVISDSEVNEQGIVRDRKGHYYFITDESENGNYITVYFVLIGKTHDNYLLYLVALILLILISYFPSKFIANQISKPIRELEDYAIEVSNRNWDADHPETDVLEIDQLCKSLDKMKKNLRIAEERDRQFLQKTSHDLKTPVMIIKGYAQAMIDGIEVDESYPTASVILNESNRLERKIQQLLQLNMIGHSLEQHDEIIRLDRLLKSLISRFKVVKPDLDWQVDLTYYELKGNAESLLVSFENIFENQIRYAKSKIAVEMIDNGHQLCINIRNDGDHFTVDNPEILFDAYKKDMEGKFGLGLAIVKKVIESHDGIIEAKNEEEGVLFKITLKVNE